ncbi:flavin reductase family protein [Rhodococcus pyridinivorans]|nr:flavin reductase family protein [Rhodococcus pyridinivorans]
MTHPITQTSALTPEQFRTAISHFASGVTIVTTHHEGVDYGATASAVCSLSTAPPSLVVCLNLASGTGKAIERTGRLAVNVLGEEDGQLASRFATKGKDRFAGVPLDRSDPAAPVLANSLASLSCRVDERIVSGTHAVHLCTVDTVTVRRGAPLVYYRGRFGSYLAQPDAALERRVREELASASPDELMTVEDLSRRLEAQPAAVAAVIRRIELDGPPAHSGTDGHRGTSRNGYHRLPA